MYNGKLHGEVTDVVYLLETVAHGIVDTNVPEYHDLMKAVIMECVFKLDAILAFEDEIQAAFNEVDLTDEF